MRYTVAPPREYDASPALATIYSPVEVLPVGDSLLVSFLGSPDILITDFDGAVLHSFRVPAVRRRGIPPDLRARLLKVRSAEERFKLSSTLFTVGRLSDGSVVFVNTDQELRAKIPIRTAFVSVVTADFGKACVDIPLPLSEDGMAWMAFRGDTLVTLEQEVAGNGARLMSRDYLLELERCDWIELKSDTAA